MNIFKSQTKKIPTQFNRETRKFQSLGGHERKFGDVCGEEFSAPARREVLPHGHQSISHADL